MLRWIVVLTAAIDAGYMVFDGVHALARGDYVTATAGEHAGQLGPWASIVAAVGIEPRSDFMKWLFVVYGIAWLAVIIAFAFGLRWAWWGMVVMAVGSLWYLVPGTIISAVVLVVLMLPAIRRAYIS